MWATAYITLAVISGFIAGRRMDQDRFGEMLAHSLVFLGAMMMAAAHVVAA